MSNPGSSARSARVGAGIAVVVVAAAALSFFLATGLPDVRGAKDWLHAAGPVGWALGVGMLALALSLPTPRSALTVLAGAVAGFAPGLAMVMIGGVLGAALGFGVSRRLGREALTRLAGDRLARVDGLVETRGFLTVVGARLMPVPPFAVVSWAAGLTKVRLRTFVLATGVGILPSSTLYVGIGASVTGFDTWADRTDGPVPALAVTTVVLILGGSWLHRRRSKRRSPHTVDDDAAAGSR
jgi:uncharacterized membrane protein YdjX (TVP38/TMEM64 family)